MRNAEEVRSLFAYNRWANRRTLDSAAALSPHELHKDLGGSFPSIRDTPVHILAAEWIWLERWRGVSPRSFLDPAEFPDFSKLTDRWRRMETEQAQFVDSVTPDALAGDLSYVNTKGATWTYPLGRMMQHVVNHSSYHRGQVSTMLRQLGHGAVSTDLLVFFDEGAPGEVSAAGTR